MENGKYFISGKIMSSLPGFTLGEISLLKDSVYNHANYPVTICQARAILCHRYMDSLNNTYDKWVIMAGGDLARSWTMNNDTSVTQIIRQFGSIETNFKYYGDGVEARKVVFTPAPAPEPAQEPTPVSDRLRLLVDASVHMFSASAHKYPRNTIGEYARECVDLADILIAAAEKKLEGGE